VVKVAEFLRVGVEVDSDELDVVAVVADAEQLA